MNEVNIELWKQANEVYNKLMDLTVSDALSQLSEMPDVNDELKSLVLALISSGNQPSRYFNQQVSDSFQAAPWAENSLKPGDAVGEYELLEELGQGGMAKVFRAKRKDASSQKPVAIKIFNRSQLSPVLLNRFAVEQDILAGLSHPNIVNMHHGGTDQEGAPYIVMDLIEEAKDVDDYCQEQGASLRQKVHFIVAAAQAIAYAHHNLIVHRDIKPSNLLVDSNRQLKVVDFGIAKLMTQEEAPQKTTIMALTPSFAAPEQINSGQISVTTDVFSLAAVLLSLIIDELPLPSDRLLKSCADDEAHVWQVLKTHIKDKDLRNILNQALQQAPEKRYRNMDLFVEDLTAWLAYKPVKATPDSWGYRFKKFAKRRSALFAALSTLAVMLVVGVTLLGWQVEKTQVEAAKANEVKDFMLGVFSVVNPDEALGEKILAKDLLSQAFAEIKAKEFKDQSIKAELLTAMGSAQLQLGLSHRAAEAFNEALLIDDKNIAPNMGALKTVMARGDMVLAAEKVAAIEAIMSTDDPFKPELLLVKSQMAIHDGDYEQARSYSQTAQSLFDQQNKIKGHLEAGRQLGNIMFLESRSEEAAEYLEKLLAMGSSSLAPTSSVILALKNDLVELYNDIGVYAEALRHAEELINDIKTVLGEKHPFLIQAYISKAGTSRGTGAIDDAKNFANMALDLSTELNGEVHETTARAMNLVGVVYYVNGEIDMALEHMKKASVLFDQALGDDNPESWDVKTNLTALLNIARRYEEAIETLEPVHQKQLDVLGPSHRSTIYSQSILARLYGDVGRLDEAQELGENLVTIAVEDLGLVHPLTVGAHFTLSKIYQQQGKFSQGVDLLERVVNSESWSDDNERAISAYNSLADLHFDNGNLPKAKQFKNKSLEVAERLLTESAPRTVAQMLRNGEFYIKINELDQAREVIERVAAIVATTDQLPAQLTAKLTELQVAIEPGNE